MPAASLIAARRADIDSLRVIALLLLIVYHVLLVYTGYWRVASEHEGYWAEYLMTLFTPWRMPLVFLVGGVAARFMFERMQLRRFVRDRAVKLLTAFVFAVALIAPLQIYVRLDEAGAPPEGYLHYLIFRAPFAIEYNGLLLPDFAHAWFLPYLFVYSVAIVLWWRFSPRSFAWTERILERTPIWALAAALMTWLAFVEAVMIARWPITGYLVPDVSAHLKFLPVFLLGALLGKSEVFRTRLLDAKFALASGATVLLAVTLYLKWTFFAHGPMYTGSPAEWYAARGLYSGVMLLAVLGFAAWLLNRPSQALTYATDAILPVYLMHQTVLVIVADVIVLRHWPLTLEMGVLFAAALAIPLIIYHFLVRRTALLRVLFGLRPHARHTGAVSGHATARSKPLAP